MCSLRKYPITRFGFDTISILELKGSGFVRTDIGKQIDKSLKAAVANGHMIPKVAEATRRLISGSAPTEEDKAKGFDDRMNEVYLAVRLVLSPARFAAVKREQIEWLKKRDATTYIEEKCKLMEARIKVLQELLW